MTLTGDPGFTFRTSAGSYCETLGSRPFWRLPTLNLALNRVSTTGWYCTRDVNVPDACTVELSTPLMREISFGMVVIV